MGLRISIKPIRRLSALACLAVLAAQPAAADDDAEAQATAAALENLDGSVLGNTSGQVFAP